jgi:hypothetical protein
MESDLRDTGGENKRSLSVVGQVLRDKGILDGFQ